MIPRACMGGWMASKSSSHGWHVAVGGHVPFPQVELKLLLGEMRIDLAEWNAVESGVPSTKEWVLPFVLAGDDVFAEEVAPVSVASLLLASVIWKWHGHVSLKPFLDNVVVELFVPHK